MAGVLKNLIFLTIYQLPTKFDDNSAANFYNAWSKAGYLKTQKVFVIEMIGMFKNIFLSLFYNITSGMEHIFNAMLKIFGIYNEMDKGAFHDIRLIIFGLGMAVLIFSLTMLAISQIWGKGDKYLKGLKSAVMFTAVVIILPWFVSSIGNATGSGAKAIGYGSGTTSMAIEPIKDNVIDVTKLNENALKGDPDKLNPRKFNNFNDANISSVNFGDVVAENNTKKLSKPVKDIFKHKVSGDTVSDSKMPSDNSGGVLKSFNDAYERYSGQFLIAILTEGVLALFLLVMAFRVGKSVYQILITMLAAPIVLYTNLQKPSRVKDIISAIIGSMIAVWSEMISVKVFIIIASTLGNNPAVRELGTGGFELGILKLIILTSSFAGFLFGVQLIERWTGVPNGSGHGMLGFMLGGAMASKAAVGLGRSAVGAAKGTAKAATSIGSGAKKGASALGNGVRALDADSLAAQAEREANPAAKVGNNQSAAKNNKNDKSNPTNSDNKNNGNSQGQNGKLNSNDDNGTGESSINKELDNGINPADGVGDESKGTDQAAIDNIEGKNGANPTDGVGDESKGTDQAAIDDIEGDNGVNPTVGVGDESKGTDQAAIDDIEGDNGVNPTTGVGDGSKGTDQAAIDDTEGDNGVNPTTGVGDGSKGTDQAAIDDTEDYNGVNPTTGVGDGSKGTDQAAIDDTEGNNGVNPINEANGLGNSNNSQRISRSKTLGTSSGLNNTSGSKELNGSTSNSLGKDLNQKLDNIGKTSNAIDNSNPAKADIGNNDLLNKMNEMQAQQNAAAKANKPKFGDKLQDTANSLSRIQQETDNSSINPPSDDDEF